MGITCSNGIVVPRDNRGSTASPSSNGSSITNTTTTIRSPCVWNPFHITTTEAEDLLSKSAPGSFVFSHDLSSELFLSLSVGKYVCHHSVVTRDNAYFVGAREFNTVGEVISYFKDHPLGEVTLKEEFKRVPMTTIQMKQHQDFSIQSRETASTSDVSSSGSEGKKPTHHGQQINPVYEASPAPRRQPNTRAPVERIDEEEVLGNVVKINQINQALSISIASNKVEPMSRKHLKRSPAIVRLETTSSGDEREVPSSISLVPLLPNQEYPIESPQIYS